MQTRSAVLAVSLWAVSLAIGWVAVTDHENAPGDAGKPPAAWPPGSGVTRSSRSADLVMLVHPHCPCTRASLQQLEVMLARCRAPVQLHVLVLRPPGSSADWIATDTTAHAARLPHVDLIVDDDGIEARRFGISVSGHVLIYDCDGRLAFSGGITGSRGHEGDNQGCDEAIAAIDGASPATAAPVFGCSILDPTCCGTR